MPVLMPGPTTSAGAPRYCLKKRWMLNTAGGTTDEMMPASRLPQANPCSSSSERTSTASSSEVRPALVSMRKCATRSVPRNTPSTVLVLPTSTARRHVITGAW
jgi:hypothetical protein